MCCSAAPRPGRWPRPYRRKRRPHVHGDCHRYGGQRHRNRQHPGQRGDRRHGNGNKASTSSDNTVLYDAIGPTGSPANPGPGGTVGQAVINGRGYIDITFADTGGSGLNVGTITDVDPEFSLSTGFSFGASDAGQRQHVSLSLHGHIRHRPSRSGRFLPGAFFDLAGNPNQVAETSFTVTDMPVWPLMTCR